VQRFESEVRTAKLELENISWERISVINLNHDIFYPNAYITVIEWYWIIMIKL
jgi:hypothetical protein